MKTVEFTPQQLDAVDASGQQADTCVVAGPGAGKTTVLVEYFRRLVEAGVDAVHILAITFTEKAAGNMRTKLADAFHEDSKTRARLERAWVSTVHGFCARLLRENAVLAGVDPQFNVADEREARRLQQEAIDSAVASLFEEHPAAVRALIRGLSSRDFEDAVLSAYDAMRGAGMTIEEVAAMPPPAGTTREDVAATLEALIADPLDLWSHDQRLHRDAIVEGAARILMASTAAEALLHLKTFPGKLPKCKRGTTAYDLVKRLKEEQLADLEYSLVTELYEHERELLVEILRRFDRIYRERKRQAGVLDFADLEEYAVGLLGGGAETRRRMQEQFDYIVMDEFQDTNGQQRKLLERLRRPERFYAVGDINQSIYGFRHAEPEVFRAYRDHASRRIELEDNFRSRADILRAVETMADEASGIETRKLIAGRRFEEPQEVSVEVIAAIAPQIDDALRNEARWVARRILEFAAGDPGFAFRDMAVLVRNSEVLPEFAEAFDEAGIPFVVNRGRGFYEIREVNDLVHLLRVIANPRDDVSLAAVLRSPLIQVSDEALLRLKTLDANLGGALLRLGQETETSFDRDDRQKLVQFRERLQTWRWQREHISFDRLLLAALDDCGYSGEPGSHSFGNVEKFLAQARQAAGRMSLDQFIDELAVVRASNPREPDAPPPDSLNAVTVMTIHSAKGLEFPIVFVAALHKGVDPNPPVVSFSRNHGLGARWRNPATGSDKSDRYQHAIHEERKQREAEEGNRVLYVAMTRAEQQLILSLSAAAGKRPGHWAREICGKLAVALEPARDEIVTRTSPHGEDWKLRVQVTDHPPDALPRPQRAEAPAPAGRVDRPPVTDQQDANATVTAVACFAKCPREYFLGHYLGYEGRARRLEDGGKLPAAELGTQVHALLAGVAVPSADPEALRLAEVFRRSPLGRRAARAAHAEREFDFLMAVDGLVLSGQVDLWFEEDGELTIVDYKTDSVTAIEAHERARDYHAQLHLYALAVERATGRAPRRAWLHFLRPDTALEVDLTPSLLDGPEQTVRDFQQAQSRLEFPLNEGEHCRRCEFFQGLCPSVFQAEKRPSTRPPALPFTPR